MFSRLLLSAAVAEVNADSAADADDAVAAASAVAASAFVAAGDGSPGGDIVIMDWLIALLAPLIALILITLSEKQHFAASLQEAHRQYGQKTLTTA